EGLEEEINRLNSELEKANNEIQSTHDAVEATEATVKDKGESIEEAEKVSLNGVTDNADILNSISEEQIEAIEHDGVIGITKVIKESDNEISVYASKNDDIATEQDALFNAVSNYFEVDKKRLTVNIYTNA